MLTPTRFNVVPEESRFVISGRSSLHPIESTSRKVRGYVDAAWNGAGSLALDVTTALHVEVPVESLASGNSMEDAKMRELVGSRSFPNVVADLQELRPLPAAGSYAVKGRVNVRGTTRVLDGEITAKRDGDRVVIEGELALDVRTFGIEPPRFLMVRVHPEVTVRLHLVAAPA